MEVKVSLDGMRYLCYFYGIFNLVIQGSVSPQRTPFWIINILSLISVIIFIFIILRFKEELNIRLNSIKMDNVINLLVTLSVLAYAASILARTYPEEVLPYQAILGIGGLVLDIIYAVRLKHLDAPLENLSKLKSLRTYANCILIGILFAVTIVGIFFAVFLISFSYVLLGNIFVEMKEVQGEPRDG